MIFPWGTAIVTLWGFSTTSPVGVVISLTEVVVVVVAKILEIASIRRIIPLGCHYDENPRNYDYPFGGDR